MRHQKQVAARLGAIFARQPPSHAFTIDTIAADAVQVADLGAAARRALERQRNADALYAAARAIAERYGADVVDLRDLDGAVLCLKFTSGMYSSGFRNLFHVA